MSRAHSLVTIFAELDIRVDGQRHEEDQGRVKQDQPRLGNVGIICALLEPWIGYLDVPKRLTEKNDDSRECTNYSGVSTLLHDTVYNRNSETTENRWQGTQSPVWYVIGRVAVTDVREVKVALKTDKPSSKSEQHLCEWRVDVEVVLAAEVVGGKLAKMDLVKATVGIFFSFRVLRRQTAETYTTWSG